VRILLVRLRLIGDVVLTTPVIRALRHAMPDATLSYLVEPTAAPIVAANPHLDEVIVARRPRGLARFGADIAVARDLRRRKFDVAIDLHGGPRASWLTLACGARERIGYAVPGRWWMYTRRHARDPHAHDRHSVENQWVLVRELHSSLDRRPDRHRDPVEMAEDPVAAARLDARLASAGIEPGAIVIVVHVGAGNRFRQWPAGHFAELVGRLAENAPNRRIILITGREGAGLAARVAAEAQARSLVPPATVATWTDLSLEELRSLIGRCALYVGGDSGPLHVASTTSAPIVALYGPTLPRVWAPWRDPGLVAELVEYGSLPCRPCEQRTCDPGDFRCLTWLSAASVSEAAERALARAQTQRDRERPS
jgi:lipopolysaccharide heptosyltransferase II